jgi:hypothetical protein
MNSAGKHIDVLEHVLLSCDPCDSMWSAFVVDKNAITTNQRAATQFLASPLLRSLEPDVPSTLGYLCKEEVTQRGAICV